MVLTPFPEEKRKRNLLNMIKRERNSKTLLKVAVTITDCRLPPGRPPAAGGSVHVSSHENRKLSPPSEVLTAKGTISWAPREDGGCFPLGQRPLAVKAYAPAVRGSREGFSCTAGLEPDGTEGGEKSAYFITSLTLKFYEMESKYPSHRPSYIN